MLYIHHPESPHPPTPFFWSWNDSAIQGFSTINLSSLQVCFWTNKFIFSWLEINHNVFLCIGFFAIKTKCYVFWMRVEELKLVSVSLPLLSLCFTVFWMAIQAAFFLQSNSGFLCLSNGVINFSISTWFF